MSTKTGTIILLNGPPSAGKDSAASYLLTFLPTAQHLTMKEDLIAITCRFYEIELTLWQVWYTTIGKEIPREELHGKSCRQALIHIAENVIKPIFGTDYFIQQFLKKCTASVVICSDVGFDIEIEKAAMCFRHVFVLRIHRETLDFKRDSRSYLQSNARTPQNVIFEDLVNNGDFDNFQKQLQEWLEEGRF